MTWTNHVVGYQIFSWTLLKCVYALFCRFQCVPLQCNLYLVHPSLSNISLNISSVWSKCSSPLIYKSALQHPYLPILSIIPKAFFSTFSKHLYKGMTLWKMLVEMCWPSPPSQVVYHRCFNLGSWLGFGDRCLVIARWFSWVPWAAVDGCLWGDSFEKLRFGEIFVEEYIVWVGEGNISSGSIYVEFHDVYQVCRGYVRCIL